MFRQTQLERFLRLLAKSTLGQHSPFHSCHRMGLSRPGWLPPQAAELAGRFRCLLVGLQGQGASPTGSARGNVLEHHATDCLAVVSALQLAGALL